jgi:hypothetical protein
MVARLTPEQREDRAMSEAALKAAVVAAATMAGWKVFTVSNAWRSKNVMKGTGYPDLTCARQGKVVFIELKRQAEQLEPKQVEWAEAITPYPHAITSTDPIRWYVIRPSDLRAGRPGWIFR